MLWTHKYAWNMNILKLFTHHIIINLYVIYNTISLHIYNIKGALWMPVFGCYKNLFGTEHSIFFS
jgi:hypothetical protein